MFALSLAGAIHARLFDTAAEAIAWARSRDLAQWHIQPIKVSHPGMVTSYPEWDELTMPLDTTFFTLEAAKAALGAAFTINKVWTVIVGGDIVTLYPGDQRDHSLFKGYRVTLIPWTNSTGSAHFTYTMEVPTADPTPTDAVQTAITLLIEDGASPEQIEAAIENSRPWVAPIPLDEDDPADAAYLAALKVACWQQARQVDACAYHLTRTGISFRLHPSPITAGEYARAWWIVRAEEARLRQQMRRVMREVNEQVDNGAAWLV